MGSLKEKPRRGKQGKEFEDGELWEQSAEISKEYSIIGQSWKKWGHKAGEI